MKCPKCDYLGFETGDRCKHCGYEFSLMSAGTEVEFDLPLREPTRADTEAWPPPEFDPDMTLNETAEEPEPIAHLPRSVASARRPRAAARVPAALAASWKEPDLSLADAADPASDQAVVAAPRRPLPALPLLLRTDDDVDEPLIKMPATPRPPLAVRRTPEAQRLRAYTRTPRLEEEPTFEFAEQSREVPRDLAPPPPTRHGAARLATRPPSGPVRRLAAALIDHAVLLGIDALVVYFTLKMAALTMADWRGLPAAPLLAFLLMLKLVYFSAFTTIGGQTIGKMAAGIRVITDEGGLIDPARALQRTLAGGVSLLTLGLAFIPALVGADRRALHDRVARTRVVVP